MTAVSTTRRARSAGSGLRRPRSDTAAGTKAGESAVDPAIDATSGEAAGAGQAIPASAPPLRLLPLCTPAEAARLLAVPESWLRRQVTAGLVPHTRLGKHLRFSHADLVRIAAAAAHPAAAAIPTRRPVRGRRPRTTTGGW